MIATFWVTLGVAVLLSALAAACFIRPSKRARRAGRWVGATLAGISVPIFGLSLYLAARWAIGQPVPLAADLPGGVVYRRDILVTPNLAVVHVLEIPRPAQQRWGVTRPTPTPDGHRAVAVTGPVAAAELRADVVINANFFSPFHDYCLFASAPATGEAVLPIGSVVSDGARYGVPKPDWPSAWQRADGSIGLGVLPKDAVHAVTGRQWLLKDGDVAVRQDEPPYPRSAIALNAAGDRMWLVVVDGKQPRYSLGLRLTDLAAYLKRLGATDAIELDGGGSAILIHQDAAGPRVLSRPCHEQIPGRRRPTGVFLGIRIATSPPAND